MDWEMLGKRALTPADRRLRQDILFARIRGEFLELSDEAFAAEIMAPVCEGVFLLAVDSILSALPEELAQAVLRALPSAS